jgi:hypothetical protein
MKIKKIEWPLTGLEPIINFTLLPPSGFVDALKAAKLDPPEPVNVRGIIDTGFTGGLVIQKSLVKGWGLKSRNFNEFSIPQDSSRFFDPCYAWESDVAVKFTKCSHEAKNVLLDPIPATLAEIVNDDNAQAVIGQEILSICTFVYCGPKLFFKFEFSHNFEIPPHA